MRAKSPDEQTRGAHDPGEIAQRLPMHHETRTGAVPHRAGHGVAGYPARQESEHPLRRKARQDDEYEGEDGEPPQPQGAPRSQRACSTTPALMMPGCPALSMVAESTRMPSCSERRASQPTTASKGAFSRRTCKPPGPDGSLLVSDLARPASRAARSTITSMERSEVGAATAGPAARSSGLTSRIHARSACLAAMCAWVRATLWSSGRITPKTSSSTTHAAPMMTMRRSRSLNDSSDFNFNCIYEPFGRI